MKGIAMDVTPSTMRRRTTIASHIAAIWAVSALFTALFGMPAAIGQPADFYRGKSVEILVGFSPGGGYDAYARALARTIGNHIPGNPQVVVKNFTGAGSLRLARYLQDAAPRDGLAFGTIDNGLMIASLMNPSVNFDAPKLSWVGSMAKELQICMTWHGSRFRSIDDMRSGEAVFGATGRDDIRYTSTNVLRRVSDARIKIVTGYPGTNDIRLALERGEIDGVCESWSSIKATKPDWLEQKKINIIVQFSFNERPDLPGVPPIGRYAGSSTQADALRLIFSSAETGRPFGAPPAIPPDRLNALRRAFDATMKDPEFIELTTKAKFDVEPSSGEQTAGFLERAYGSPPAAIDAARKLLEQ
jgi:tripartite-type tricarboxylate transporter receptor subunit TctC